jgi:hypothetical protein
VIGGRRGLHDEELRKLYSSPSVIRMNKSRNVRLTGNVARMGIRAMHTRFRFKIQKERGHLKRLNIDIMIILRRIFKK